LIIVRHGSMLLIAVGHGNLIVRGNLSFGARELEA
jgi:hypothetical protein